MTQKIQRLTNYKNSVRRGGHARFQTCMGALVWSHARAILLMMAWNVVLLLVLVFLHLLVVALLLTFTNA